MTDGLQDWTSTRAKLRGLTVLDSVESTNQWAQENPLEPFQAVISLNQTSGRGRWNRKWVAKTGEALALSVAVPVRDSTDTTTGVPVSWLPLIAGASMVRAVRQSGVLEVGLKWPNDVLVSDRKLSGILVEGAQSGVMIVGVGINLTFGSDPPAPRAISLRELVPLSDATLDDLVSNFLSNLFEMWEGSSSAAREAVESVMITLGRSVRVVSHSGDTWEGRAEALDDFGGLMVRNPSGELLSQSATDIEHLYQ